MGAVTQTHPEVKPRGERAQRWLARALIAAALVVGGCATGDRAPDEVEEASFDDDPRLGESANMVCFAGRLSGFYAEGPRAIVLRRTREDAYLVQTGYCPSLHGVEAVGLPHASRCVSRGDELFISDTVFNDRDELADRSQRCRILSIHDWNEDAVEQDEAAEPGSSDNHQG